MRRYIRLGRWNPALKMAAFGLVVAGCGQMNYFQEAEDFRFEVRNETNSSIKILKAADGNFSTWSEVEPRNSTHIMVGGAKCANNSYSAQLEDGLELARLEPPVCAGDIWVIEDQ